LVGTGIAMQLCKSGSADAADKLGCTVSATLRIGCDWQLGRSVIGMLLCIELHLGYVVLQVALLRHAIEYIALMFTNGIRDDCEFR